MNCEHVNMEDMYGNQPNTQPMHQQTKINEQPYINRVRYPTQLPIQEMNQHSISTRLKQRLNLYILDYLTSQQYYNTASVFEKEINSVIPRETETSGFLLEWWYMFWNIHGNRIEKQQPIRRHYADTMQQFERSHPPPSHPSMLSPKSVPSHLEQTSHPLYQEESMDDYLDHSQQSDGNFSMSMNQYNQDQSPEMYRRHSNPINGPSQMPHMSHPSQMSSTGQIGTASNVMNGSKVMNPSNSISSSNMMGHPNVMNTSNMMGPSNVMGSSCYMNSSNVMGNRMANSSNHMSNADLNYSQQYSHMPHDMRTRQNVYKYTQPYYNQYYPPEQTNPESFSSPSMQSYVKGQTTNPIYLQSYPKVPPTPPTPTPAQAPQPTQDKKRMSPTPSIQVSNASTATKKKKSPPKKLKITTDLNKKTMSPTNTPVGQTSTPHTPNSNSVGMEYSQSFTNDEYSAGWSNQSKSTSYYSKDSQSTGSPNAPSSANVSSKGYHQTDDIFDVDALEMKKSNASPSVDVQSAYQNQQIQSSQSFIDSSIDDYLIEIPTHEAESTKALEKITTLQHDDFQQKIINCSFNVSGDLLATSVFQKGVCIWDTQNYILRSFHPNVHVSHVSFSPDIPNIFATSSFDGSIALWDSNMMDDSSIQPYKGMIQRFESQLNCSIHSIDFNPYNSYILCSSDSSGHLKIWDTKQEKAIAILNEAAIKLAKFSSNGRRIAAGCSKTINIFDTETNKLLHCMNAHSKPIQSLHWAMNDSLLISASEDSVKVWRIGSHAECIGTFAQQDKKYYAIPHPMYADRQVIIGSYMSILVWDYSSSNKMMSDNSMVVPAHNGIVSSLCSFGTSLMASTSHDACTSLWKVGE